MTRTPKIIGARIIEVCSIVEKHGVCGSPEVMPEMGIEMTNVLKYLSRGVSHGFLTVDRTARPHQYKTVNGWRERITPITGAVPLKPRQDLDVLRAKAIEKSREFRARQRATADLPHPDRQTITQVAISGQPKSIWDYAQRKGAA